MPPCLTRGATTADSGYRGSFVPIVSSVHVNGAELDVPIYEVDAVVRRSDRFVKELLWMAKVLRYGREQVNVDEEAVERLPPVVCPVCGTTMTHHADKEVSSVPPLEDVTVLAAHACRNCGAQQAMVTSVTG